MNRDMTGEGIKFHAKTMSKQFGRSSNTKEIDHV